MILRTFWIWHPAQDGPDCEAAWSQEYVDINPEGWDEIKQTIRSAYEPDVLSEREIEIMINYNDVLKQWLPEPIDGKVKED